MLTKKADCGDLCEDLRRPQDVRLFAQDIVMNFSVTDDQLAIIDAVQALCRDFDADYWADRDQSGQFPHDFH
nr:hypothetical protein [Betaproteobacteria bacterium]